MSAIALSEVAVVVDPADNCAVVKLGVEAGTIVELDGRRLEVQDAIGPGHRFAIE